MQFFRGRNTLFNSMPGAIRACRVFVRAMFAICLLCSNFCKCTKHRSAGKSATRPASRAAEARAGNHHRDCPWRCEWRLFSSAGQVGTLDGEPLKNAPLSATIVTRDLMNDQVARLLSDVVKNDASIEDDYVPVGYYGVYQIRGFPIDLATGLEINGMTIAGEQDVPLENKERVELLNGLAGVESGVAAGAGLIDYVTKRPALVHALDFATDQYGTAYGAADLGRFFGSRKQVGARMNLAGERIETYMDGTGGWRAVGAGAADWKISPMATLEGDFEYQHKTERDGSGYQLLGGTTLPDINLLSRSTMLGEQAWAPPDTYDTFNTGARLNVTLSPTWTAFAAASLSHSLIQDNVMYAYGSSLDPNTYLPNCPNAPNAPAYFFCPDGTYGIYDYRDPGELRQDGELEAMATGQVKTAPSRR